ncbi:unnamed protein product [Sphagnum balticum]
MRPIPNEEKEDDQVEVEKILEHRFDEKNNVSYLVKWKDHDASENEWVTEDNFGTMEIINEYWKSIHRKDQPETTSPIEPKKRGRPPKVALLGILTFFFFLLTMGQAQTVIRSNFLYCQLQSKTVVDEDSCIPSHMESRLRFPEIMNYTVKFDAQNRTVVPDEVKLKVLKRMRKEVTGVGIRCKMETIIGHFDSYFFTGRTPPIFEYKNVILSKDDCKRMIETGVCDVREGSKMTCENSEHCSFTKNPEESYSWPHQISTTGYRCSTTRIVLEGDLSRPILADCMATKGFCVLESSTVIWNASIIHECPYEALTEASFKWVTPSIIRSEREKIALELLERKSICNENHLAYSTSEGLYVTKAELSRRTRHGRPTRKSRRF